MTQVSRVRWLLGIGAIAVSLAAGLAYLSRPLSPNELRQLSIQELRRRSEQGADKVAALCVLGERLSASGQADAAGNAYGAARQLDPSSAQALAGWITSQVGPRAPCQAEAALRELAQAQPAVAAPQLSLGELYLSVDDLPHAEPFLREAVRLLPDDSQVCFRYGDWLARRGLRGKAVEQLLKAARLAPKVPEYRIALLDLLVLQGRHEDAAAHLKIAKGLAPASPPLAFYEAKLLLAKQDASGASSSEAVALLRKARDLAPHWLSPRMLLASRSLSQGKPSDAIAELESARSEGNDDLQMWALLAQAYQRLGKPAEAKEAQRGYERLRRETGIMNGLMNAAIAAPKDVEAKLRLARALRSKGVLLSALAAHRDVLALDPKQSEAMKAIHALTAQ